MQMRAWIRRKVPQRLRRAARSMAREVPIRILDAIPDSLDRFRADPLPPPALRAAVGIDSSRAHYSTIGKHVAADILSVVPPRGRWLDFGCGSGRVARHIAAIEAIELTGVDVDALAVRWCARHLRGDFRLIDANPPLPFAGGSFDVIYAISVFTHLDEPDQLRWLAELRRVLRDSGALILSTHSPELTYNRPDLSAAHHQDLANRGFTFIRGSGEFNEDSAFHHPAYIEHVCRRFFRSIEHRPRGIAGYQDLTICFA